MDISNDFLSSAIKRFKEYKELGDKTFVQLDDEQMHYQPNTESNSIAIIIQHLHGNMLSRWTNFLAEDGEKSWRKRDDEFEIHQATKQQLIDKWNEGWKTCLQALESLTPSNLSNTITIRTQPLIVVDAIVRQLAHYSSHVGQIIYIGKLVKATEWQTLSIPRGKSKEFQARMRS